MKILFLTDNFPPESNAPATRTYEHAVEWLQKGAEVTVITCAPNYPKGEIFGGYKNQLYQTEDMDGIRVIRVWSYMAENRGTFKRILDYLSFAFMAFWAGLFVKTDVIVATSPQFFTAVAGYMLHAFKRKPWVFEIRDLWPESIKAVGAMKAPRSLAFLEWMELYLYRKATQIVVVTDSFKDNLVSRGIKASKIHIVKNGVYLNKFKPVEKDPKLLRQLGLTDKFIFAYLGTHGLAHKLDFILESAAKIKDPRIHFFLIGDGAEKENLLALHQKLSLTNVTLYPSVSKHEIARFIGISDVALVNLKKSDTFKTVIPSKIFENAAMQKPILLGVEGESKVIIKSYKAGLCFEPENTQDFIQKLSRLALDDTFYRSCQDGCQQLAQDFSRARLANEMLNVLQLASGKNLHFKPIRRSKIT